MGDDIVCLGWPVFPAAIAVKELFHGAVVGDVRVHAVPRGPNRPFSDDRAGIGDGQPLAKERAMVRFPVSERMAGHSACRRTSRFIRNSSRRKTSRSNTFDAQDVFPKRVAASFERGLYDIPEGPAGTHRRGELRALQQLLETAYLETAQRNRPIVVVAATRSLTSTGSLDWPVPKRDGITIGQFPE
jgi:hypothetical protein